MDSITTPISEVNFSEKNGILHIKIFENANIDLKLVGLHFEKIDTYLGHRKYLALIDSSRCYSFNREAWLYNRSKETLSKMAAAAHYNATFTNKLNINFYKMVYGSSVPIQVFERKEDALAWLLMQSALLR